MRNLLFVSTLFSFAMAATEAQAMPISEVAELQFHKVNQLAETKKIDAGFVDHLASVALQKDSASPNYLVIFRQESDANETPAAVTIKADTNGKAQGFVASPGKLAAQPADWGGKAPLDLLEKAVEYVVDSTTDPLTPPFRDHFTAASISPFASGNGLIAKVVLSAGAGDGALVVLVDLNGNILSSSKQ